MAELNEGDYSNPLLRIDNDILQEIGESVRSFEMSILDKLQDGDTPVDHILFWVAFILLSYSIVSTLKFSAFGTTKYIYMFFKLLLVAMILVFAYGMVM